MLPNRTILIAIALSSGVVGFYYGYEFAVGRQAKIDKAELIALNNQILFLQKKVGEADEKLQKANSNTNARANNIAINRVRYIPCKTATTPSNGRDEDTSESGRIGQSGVDFEGVERKIIELGASLDKYANTINALQTLCTLQKE